jgi:hypothetical protein
VKRPRLTSEDHANESRLPGLVDQLFEQDPSYWKLTRRIFKLQLRHQELASEDAFVALLDLEAAWTERVAWMLAEVARWAGWRRRG